jgi:hypothetical protein
MMGVLLGASDLSAISAWEVYDGEGQYTNGVVLALVEGTEVLTDGKASESELEPYDIQFVR